MTANEALSVFNMYFPNTLDESVKWKWLSKAELAVKNILNGYQANEHKMIELSPENDGDTELLAPAPYSDLYRNYLLAEVNLLYGDTGKYNVFASLYVSALEEFRNWCVRNLASKSKVKQFQIV